jgi:hypothetical protein
MRKRLTKDFVKGLIKRQLQKGEREGTELYKEFSEGGMLQEELEAAIDGIDGYGVWWGVESSWGLVSVEVEDIEEERDGQFKVRTKCVLERIGAQAYSPDTPLMRSNAKVSFKVNRKLDIEEFRFEWE